MSLRIPRLLSLAGLALASLALTVAGARPDWAQAATPGYLPGEVVLNVKPRVNVQQLARDYRMTVAGQVPGTHYYRFTTTRNVSVVGVAATMRRDPRVVAADVNPHVMNPVTAVQWTTAFDTGTGPTIAAGQPALPQINLNRAHEVTTGQGVIVAVLDTGISTRDPELAPHILAGWNAQDGTTNTDDAPTGLDLDGDGKKDEGAGHGTMIAGLVHRLAPDAQILPVKIMNSEGAGTVWQAMEGIQYAIAHGAKVINLSMSAQAECGVFSKALDEARKKDILIVTSAGNSATDRPQVPAKYSFVLAVAGVDGNNRKAPFSNWGSNVGVSAPAVDVVSNYWDGTWRAWSGTSFAAGLVSGEAALVRARFPSLRADKVVRRIEEAAVDIDRLNPRYKGKLGREGLINIDAAVGLSGGGGGDDDDDDDDH